MSQNLGSPMPRQATCAPATALAHQRGVERHSSPALLTGKSHRRRQTRRKDLACAPTTASVPSPCQTTLPGLTSSSHRASGKPSRADNVFIAGRYGLNCPCRVAGSGESAVAFGSGQVGTLHGHTAICHSEESPHTPLLLADTWGSLASQSRYEPLATSLNWRWKVALTSWRQVYSTQRVL